MAEEMTRVRQVVCVCEHLYVDNIMENKFPSPSHMLRLSPFPFHLSAIRELLLWTQISGVFFLRNGNADRKITFNRTSLVRLGKCLAWTISCHLETTRQEWRTRRKLVDVCRGT